jgi:L-arabinose 1-dehydrogenase [NAD(P)+]
MDHSTSVLKNHDMRVVITGAAGRIGVQLVEELAPCHELILVDRVPVPGRNSIVADLSRTPAMRGLHRWLQPRRFRWNEAFNGADVVVHLAANAAAHAPWQKVLQSNIQASWNTINSAVKHGVSRVVFASSNWVTRALEQQLAPDCYLPTARRLTPIAHLVQ